MKRPDIFIRLLVGCVFLSEGLQKFIFPDTLGSGRFLHLGIPFPQVMGSFVGAVETICGGLLILNILPGLFSVPLLSVILVAIATTKLPMLLDKGFWPTVHEGRADFSMLMGLLFLIFTFKIGIPSRKKRAN